jgi:hypothetical protein
MNIQARSPLAGIGATAAAIVGLLMSAAQTHAADAPADAQAPSQAQTAPAVPAPQQDAAQVSDEKLLQFAEAAADVQKIQEDYAAKAQTLQKVTEDKIVSSVQDAGMTVAEFTSLVELVQTDPALAQRLNGLQPE